MKVAGIVVFNPEQERLLENVNAAYRQVDRLVLYLNSAFDRTLLKDYPEIEYITEGRNDGIAKALNRIMAYAEAAGASWCLLLDQDSVISPDYLDKMEAGIRTVQNAGIIAPIVADEYDREMTAAARKRYEQTDMCITSGSYNSIKAWKDAGGFREEFFIDYVDWEYCARLRKNGYFIWQNNEARLSHQLGARTYHRFLGKNLFTFNHSAFRKYYITRNTIVTFWLYPDEPKLAHPYMRTAKRLLITVLYETDKKNKVKAILRGVKDARTLYHKLKEKH